MSERHIPQASNLPHPAPVPSSEIQGSRLERPGYWSRLSVRFGFLLGGGGGQRGLVLVIRVAFDLSCSDED